MNNLHGIILAYHSDRNLGELTKPRNTCSLSFGGSYRLIDFMLSSLVNAGVTDVGLIVHESYQSLLDHVGSGKDWELSRKHGGLRILPPFSAAERTQGEYRGTMEALHGVSSYLQNIRQEYVLLTWGNLAVNLPVEDIFQQHVASGSDITIVCSEKHWGLPTQCQYVKADETGRVVDLSVKPAREPDMLESLEVYVISRELLLNLVEDCAAHDLYSMSRGVLLRRVHTLKLQTYVYSGYVGRFHSVQDYFDHSMNLLKPEVRSDLFNTDSPIRTKDYSNSSTYYGPDSKSVNSLIADGCVIEGEVENSILSRGVVVKQGAKVSNCVLMNGTVVGKNAILSHAIADKNVQIGDRRILMGQDTYPITIAKDTKV